MLAIELSTVRYSQNVKCVAKNEFGADGMTTKIIVLGEFEISDNRS